MSIDHDRARFCRNVCYLRKKYHLPLISMAMLLGTSRNSIRLLEEGVISNRITAKTLIRLHEVFRIPIQPLFSEDMEEQDQQGIQN